MREIKFRGRRLNNDPQTGPADGWVTGFYYQDLCGDEIRHFITSCPCVWEVDPETVGQYTGLHDKNGKEVYEGDIVEWENLAKRTMHSVIRYIYNGFTFANFDGEDEEVWSYTFEVIGNIHDNPELMKRGKQ